MWQCGKFFFLMLFFLLCSTHASIARIPVPVVLDFSAAQIRPTVDNFVMTNIDTLPYDEEDSKYPTALQEGQSISTINIMSEGLIRERRQIFNPLLRENYLFFGNEQFLVNINRDGTGVQGIRSGTRNMIAVDFDIRDGYMFWSDVIAKHIVRTKLDGTLLTILVQTGITTPDGIAWDWVNKKLYWTDAGDRDIEVLDPNTGMRSVVLLTGRKVESIPRAIVLDPFARKIYWTDWGSQPRIERVSYDGTQREILHSLNLQWPNAMTLDLVSQTLYWADAILDRIECSNSDGSGRRILINQFISHPFGIDFFDGTLYWTDWELRAVLNSTITHSSTPGVYTIYGVISNLLNRPMGLKVVSLSKQPLVRPPEQPTCTLSCQNGGNCTQPGVCNCSLGWTGVICETPICESLCLNGGTCSAPGNCTCPARWTGSTCNEAMCGNIRCLHGKCAKPNQCFCNAGWQGKTCEEAVCFPPSGCQNEGLCDTPGICSCVSGWTGERCDKGICKQNCNGHGSCVSPNQCDCDEEWSGPTCNQLSNV